MGIRSLKSYGGEYKEFYEGVLELARMEDQFSRRPATNEEEIKYRQIADEILSQCPPGTNIEDLIGLVVVGEDRRSKNT